MLILEIEKAIDEWTALAKKNDCYDIAILKIWIRFEIYLRDAFILYSTGRANPDTGYKPSLKLNFKTEEQLNAFIKCSSSQTYIDYLKVIEKISKHLFDDDPFDYAIFSNSNNYDYFNKLQYLRNLIVHESYEAIDKYTKSCLGGNSYISPNDYLKSESKKKHTSYYTILVSCIKDMAYLVAHKTS